MKKITISEFVRQSSAELDIKILGSAGGIEKKELHSSRIQKLGLALAGFSHYIHQGRLQIVGQSEIDYLKQLPPADREKAIRNLDLEKISCILITKNLEPPSELTEIAEEFELPVLVTPKVSSIAISLVTNLLQTLLAPEKTIHGVLMEVFGIGVLICGESGIGKSECALDLITRGHRLIADDAVLIKKIGEKLEGSSPELIREFLEIRGLGIINIRDLFGVSAVGKAILIELCIELKKWNQVADIERLGIDRRYYELFDIEVEKVELPVSPGRNLSTLVETAVRIFLLRSNGYDATEKLVEKHFQKITGV